MNLILNCKRINLRVTQQISVVVWGNGGGVQHELLNKTPKTSFKNMRPLL
jgi:hypothetical protein